ncbi:MAG: efflux RND transporter periplasmic adaptor subunit [Deltaproteobacteria bacterium]
MRAIVLSTLVPALVLGIGCKKPDDANATVAKTPTPTVKAATIVAAEAPTPDVLTLTGMITADQRSDVTADTQGKVINVMVERGQHVKLGQPVVQLDVRSAALSAREAQAALQSARVSKQLADDECARTKQLLDKGAITKSEFDRQNTQCLNAVEQVAQAQARNDMMSKSVADGMVRAPFDGVVSEKNVSPGEWVAPGKALFTLVDDDPLKIELSVPEKAVTVIKKDQRVEIVAVSQPDKRFGATINRLGAEIGKSRALTAEAVLDKDSGLVPGMFAEAHIIIGQSPRIVLPAEAVVRRGDTWHAFVVKNGVAEDHIVQLSASPGDGKVAIVQGVDKGDKVVAKVTDQLVDGVKVQE